ncbi:MAG: GGDEF domain-containing protein [Clostridia bacterium]|nr:GGDEF domain-containing protein [Clostridia bacterium]
MNSNSIISHVAMALMIDYSSVYYIDVETSHYQCYSTNQGYKNLELQASGEDFFADCRRDIRLVIHPDDWDMVSELLTRDTLLQKFRDNDTISVVYRLMIDGKPVYHTMRIMHNASGEEDCIILGVLNVDKTVRTEMATKTYNAIAKTLANRYATIYYVDLATEHYVEYSATNAYKDLEVPPEGDDFFNESRKNSLRVVHPEDQQILIQKFTRKNILAKTENGRRFQLEYRLMLNGEAHYVRLIAVQTDNRENLIVAVDNIDEEVKNQNELKAMSKKNQVFTHIAESLANQYGMIYYIDTETDEYIEFVSTDEYKEFNISPTGSDFFGTSQRNVSMIARPEDRERLFDALDKRTMLQKLQENGSFSMTYQLMMGEGSGYTWMTVFWANDHKHLIMGVMNIDNEIQRENAMKKMIEENAIFSQIAESLANQYDTIYYVDMLTDHYVEFTSTDVYKNLAIQPAGDDFFRISLENTDRVIHPEDREAFKRIITKPTLIQTLAGKHMIFHTYRVMMPDGPQYARMSIIWANDNKHLIIGVMNVDQEVRREQKVQQELQVANVKAYRDELTGVKNKAAYKEMEAKLQGQIDGNEIQRFAILVCDVNGLKTINDNLGHIEGDAYIRSASSLICHIWAHSPVYRVGGDEFVVVMTGEDYEHRYQLHRQMEAQVKENQKNGKVVIASGLSEFVLGMDIAVTQVFERADGLMYENKALLKQ